jgi:hypothetical protein
MCQAIQALGISPDLMRVSDGSKRKSQTVARIVRGYLYSATKSGIAPILIIKRADGSRHAVTTTGMRLKEDYDPAVHVEGYYDEAMNMHGLYVHDDRVGPNVRADLQDDPLGLKVRLRTFVDSTNPAATIYESWDLTHILLPMHAKIRFSFGALSDFALEVLAQVGTVRDFWVKNSVINATADVTIRSENWLALASGYIESLLFGESTFDRSIVPRLTTTIPLPRYVGIVRFRAAFLDPIDVIVDTTSTRRNLHCVAVLPLSNQRIETLPLAGWLAGVFKTQVVP